ncbi:MAG: PDDEXK nuclease domain-containing protein [Betaproteobacteria bacterium]|nr:PDDEXK nuclease domain-containing protein [Betaproteobacteria bacterium]
MSTTQNPGISETASLTSLIAQIAEVVQQARSHVRQSVNQAMVASYWEIGRLIVEHEQQGQARAAYGRQQLAEVSVRLTAMFGKGFDATNLRHMRNFYQAFPIRDAVRRELGWNVRLYDEQIRGADDNPTIGLVLCSEKSEAVVRYSVLAEQQQLFAAKYLPWLPSEEELKHELERERELALQRLAQRQEAQE